MTAATKHSSLAIRSALAVHRMSAFLPVRWSAALGASIGPSLLRRQKRRHAIARANLELCFANDQTASVDALLEAHGAALGRGIAESAIAWYAGRTRIERLVKFSGVEHLEEARSRGRGVLLICGHFTTLELSVRSLGLITDFTGVWRPLGEPATDARTRQGRLRSAETLVEKSAFRPALRTLRNGGVVAIAIDQADSTDSAIIAPFFGQPASSIDTPGRLARQRGCAVLPFVTRTAPNGYLTDIAPPLEGLAEMSSDAAATEVNRVIEQQVRQSPAEYYWVHRRFKYTLPEIYAN